MKIYFLFISTASNFCNFLTLLAILSHLKFAKKFYKWTQINSGRNFLSNFSRQICITKILLQDIFGQFNNVNFTNLGSYSFYITIPIGYNLNFLNITISNTRVMGPTLALQFSFSQLKLNNYCYFFTCFLNPT